MHADTFIFIVIIITVPVVVVVKRRRDATFNVQFSFLNAENTKSNVVLVVFLWLLLYFWPLLPLMTVPKYGKS